LLATREVEAVAQDLEESPVRRRGGFEEIAVDVQAQGAHREDCHRGPVIEQANRIGDRSGWRTIRSGRHSLYVSLGQALRSDWSGGKIQRAFAAARTSRDVGIAAC